jgi:hypothetical protein
MLVPFVVLLIGLSAMLYSRIFSDDNPNARNQQIDKPNLGTMFNNNHLPTTPTNILNSGDARQVITSDLRQPASVTEHTTKLLERNK